MAFSGAMTPMNAAFRYMQKQVVRAKKSPPLHALSDRLAGSEANQTPWSLAGKRWVKQCVYATLVLVTFIWISMVMRSGEGSKETVTVNVNTGTTESQTPDEGAGQGQRPFHPEDITQMSTLDTALLPGKVAHPDEARGRRLIFIGDIHGCYDELISLLTKAEYNKETDHIVATGDMVNKGPKSAAVVEFLIAEGASCVRGNHDDKILKKAAQAQSMSESVEGVEDPVMQLAASLTEEQLGYLRTCPIILQIGEVPPHENIVVVHGGLVPSLQLVEQDPQDVMNMRIIHMISHHPSKDHRLDDYIAWAELWNQEQMRHLGELDAAQNGAKVMLDAHFGTTVVYGHDAKSGLRLEKYTRGLDSGCVRGRQLTALVLSDNSKEEIIQVQCKKYA